MNDGCRIWILLSLLNRIFSKDGKTDTSPRFKGSRDGMRVLWLLVGWVSLQCKPCITGIR